MRLALLLFLALPAGASPRLGYADYARLHARLMDKETARDLEKDLPGLTRNLKAAADVSRRHWTDCTVFDELAKAEILSEKAMASLGIPRAVNGGVVHAPAGLMHTYGYLFSQLQTPYGLKGKRWIESRLDERLGLPAGAFGPLATGGEFTSNLTAALRTLTGAPAARTLGRVEQRVTWKTPDGGTVKASVLTYLVPLTPLPGFDSPDNFLLIYGVRRDGRLRFTTAFPVGSGFADGIMATKPDREPAFKPRFNLFVDPAWVVTAQENTGWRSAARP